MPETSHSWPREVYIGINDVWHGEQDPAKGTLPEAFASGLKEIVGRCTAAGAAVVICTPTMIGEKKDGANSLDQKLDQYSDIILRAGEIDAIGGDSTVALSLRRQGVPSAERRDYSKGKHHFRPREV